LKQSSTYAYPELKVYDLTNPNHWKLIHLLFTAMSKSTMPPQRDGNMNAVLDSQSFNWAGKNAHESDWDRFYKHTMHPNNHVSVFFRNNAQTPFQLRYK
jgi:hypothetical protein